VLKSKGRVLMTDYHELNTDVSRLAVTVYNFPNVMAINVCTDTIAVTVHDFHLTLVRHYLTIILSILCNKKQGYNLFVLCSTTL
jgi:hypothetical protein